ncbi:MAG: hypothetical protein Q9162_001889 [Coniocarpon cinnabarinum]
MAEATSTINALASLTPPSNLRSWQSAPHPYLPLVATASSDKIVRIYSLTTFTQQSQITGGHKRSVRAVAWKPGLPSDPDSVLATGSFDATAGIWKGENRKRRIGGAALSRFRQSRDDGGNDLVDDTVDEEELEPLDSGDEDDYAYAVQLTGHDSEIKSLTWSPHGTFLASCSRDKSVWIWETLPDEEDNLETVAVLQEHEGDVKCVAWHPSDEGCLVSGSYDDSVRIWREDIEGEWTCVGLGDGHKGTVWCVAWEPISHLERMQRLADSAGRSEDESGAHEAAGINPADDDKPQSGPRIMSCSDDLTIRLWRRRPKPPRKQTEAPKIPSIIRSTSDEEDWFEEQQLPKVHERPIYAISWSEMTGRVVSCASDGKIVVYEETKRTLPVSSSAAPLSSDSDVAMYQVNGNHDVTEGVTEASGRDALQTEWHVRAILDAAHGVFEVNHVCWSRRHDGTKRHRDEEVIVSTGDDGEVNIWTVD